MESKRPLWTAGFLAERTKPAEAGFLAEWTEPAGADFQAERTEPAGADFQAAWTELDADGREKENGRKAEKGMDFNCHCIADDSDQCWRTCGKLYKNCDRNCDKPV